MFLARRSAYLLHDIDHFRIEVSDPVHLKINVAFIVSILQYTCGGQDQCSVHAFALVFGHYTEENAQRLFVCLSQRMPYEFHFTRKIKFAIDKFEYLV